MKKKTESDDVRGKQQQQQVADDGVERRSNEFPNFMALTEDEKLALFESLNAARETVLASGMKISDRFGTVHDEYLDHCGRVDGTEVTESFKEPSEKLDPDQSSLQPEPSRSNYSGIPRRAGVKPLETIFVQMNMPANYSSPSVLSLKTLRESKPVMSKGDEQGGSGIKPKQARKSKSPKWKRPTREDSSNKVKKKSSSKLPKLNKKESPRVQKEESSSSHQSQFEALKSDEEDSFLSILQEARESILKVSPDLDSEIMSVSDIMKEYESAKEESRTMIKLPCRKRTFIKGKASNITVKVIIASSESETKRTRNSEKEIRKKGTTPRAEKEKRSKDTERKTVRPTDGSRKKAQRPSNTNNTARKPKQGKRAQKRGKPTTGSEEPSQDNRTEGEEEAMNESETAVTENPGGEQEMKTNSAEETALPEDIANEKTENPEKKESSATTLELKESSPSSTVEENKQEQDVAEESKEDLCPPERPKEPAESVETVFFVDEFKSTEDFEDEGKVTTEETKGEETQPDNSPSSKTLTNESNEEMKCSAQGLSLAERGASRSLGTTDEEITIELIEQVSEEDSLETDNSAVMYQPIQTHQPIQTYQPEETHKRVQIRDPEAEAITPPERVFRQESPPLVTSDEDSVLRLWEELKRLQLSESDYVMETESMIADMESEDTQSQSRFTFLPNKTTQNKVQLAEEKLILVGSGNEQQGAVGGRREAAVLDLLKSEGVVVVDGDAVDKLKNLVEALQKETKPDTKEEVDPGRENLKTEHSQQLLEYLDYLKRLLHMLTYKREQNPKSRVRPSLMVAGSHPDFFETRSIVSDSEEKPRSRSDTFVPDEMKTKIGFETKESTPQDSQGSEVKSDPSSSLSSICASRATTSYSSSIGDGIPSITTPDTRKKLIEDFLRERAKLVEESIEGFKIVKVASRVTKPQPQNKTKFKFFHIFSRFCKCVKKKGSDEDQVQRR